MPAPKSLIPESKIMNLTQCVTKLVASEKLLLRIPNDVYLRSISTCLLILTYF